MPRNFDEAGELTPDQRRQEIARILAPGFLSLHRRAALPSAPATESEKTAEFQPNSLEVPGELRLSGHTG